MRTLKLFWFWIRMIFKGRKYAISVLEQKVNQHIYFEATGPRPRYWPVGVVSTDHDVRFSFWNSEKKIAVWYRIYFFPSYNKTELTIFSVYRNVSKFENLKPEFEYDLSLKEETWNSQSEQISVFDLYRLTEFLSEMEKRYGRGFRD